MLQGVTEHDRDHKITEAPRLFVTTNPADPIPIVYQLCVVKVSS